MDHELRVERVSKHFGTRRALDAVSLGLGGDGVVAIVGEAGAGKSTLARILVGLERPSSGSVTFDGRDLAGQLQTRLGRAAFRRAVQYLPELDPPFVRRWTFVAFAAFVPAKIRHPAGVLRPNAAHGPAHRPAGRAPPRPGHRAGTG